MRERERESCVQCVCVMRGFAATAISELGGAAKWDGLVPRYLHKEGKFKDFCLYEITKGSDL